MKFKMSPPVLVCLLAIVIIGFGISRLPEEDNTKQATSADIPEGVSEVVDIDDIAEKSAPSKKLSRPSVETYTFRDEKYGQPFEDVNWHALSRERCSVFNLEEKIFIHVKISGYDSSCPHVFKAIYYLPKEAIEEVAGKGSVNEDWVVWGDENITEKTVPVGREPYEGDFAFREGFALTKAGPRLVKIYFDEEEIKEIKVRRKGEFKS